MDPRKLKPLIVVALLLAPLTVSIMQNIDIGSIGSARAQAQQPSAQLWWRDGNTVCVPIQIIERSGNDLTDYAVRIVFNITNLPYPWLVRDPNGRGAANIYFIDSEGNPLYYWIEFFHLNTLVAWVKVPYIPADSSITIYACVTRDGSNLYEPYNDPHQVFLFFDDFASIDNSTWINTSKGWEITTYTLLGYNLSVLRTAGGGILFRNMTLDRNEGYAVGGFVIVEDIGDVGGLGFVWSLNVSNPSAVNGYTTVINKYTCWIVVRAVVNGTEIGLRGIRPPHVNTWMELGVYGSRIVLNIGARKFSDIYRNDTYSAVYIRAAEAFARTVEAVDTTFPTLRGFGIYALKQFYVDFIYLRRFVYPEPLVVIPDVATINVVDLSPGRSDINSTVAGFSGDRFYYGTMFKAPISGSYARIVVEFNNSVCPYITLVFSDYVDYVLDDTTYNFTARWGRGVAITIDDSGVAVYDTNYVVARYSTRLCGERFDFIVGGGIIIIAVDGLIAIMDVDVVSTSMIESVNTSAIVIYVPSENYYDSVYVDCIEYDVYAKPQSSEIVLPSIYGFKTYDFGYGGVGFPTHSQFIVVNNTIFMLFVHGNYLYYSYSTNMRDWSAPAQLTVCISCQGYVWTMSGSSIYADASLVHVMPVNKTHYVVVLLHDIRSFYVAPLGANLTVLLVEVNLITMRLDVVSGANYDLISMIGSPQTMVGAALVNDTIYIALNGEDAFILAVNMSDWSAEVINPRSLFPELADNPLILGSVVNVNGLVVVFGISAYQFTEIYESLYYSSYRSIYVPRMFMMTYDGYQWRLMWLGSLYYVNVPSLSISTALMNNGYVMVVYHSGDGSRFSYAVVDPFTGVVYDAGVLPIDLLSMNILGSPVSDYGGFPGTIVPMLVSDPKHGYVLALIPFNYPCNDIYVSVYNPYTRSWSKAIRAFYLSRNLFVPGGYVLVYHFGSVYPAVIYENGDPYIIAAVMTEMQDASYINILTATIDYTYPVLILPSPTLSPTTLPPPQPWAPPTMFVLFAIMAALGVGGLVYVLARR